MRIGTTLLFKDGYCYQSYGWSVLRPLGVLQNALKHLDKYELDEICILRPVRDRDQTYHQDINRLRNAKSSTPLAFGGGIRNPKDIQLLDGLPVERFVVSSALFNMNTVLLETLNSKYGQQAIVGFIPFSFKKKFQIFNSKENRFQSLRSLNPLALELCDEVVLHDCDSEGCNTGFNQEAVDILGINRNKLIYSGGVSDMAKHSQEYKYRPKSILIENKILHRENSIKSVYGAM